MLHEIYKQHQKNQIKREKRCLCQVDCDKRNAVQVGIDTNVSAKLQAAAKALDQARKMLYRLDYHNVLQRKNLVLIQTLHVLMNVFKFNCNFYVALVFVSCLVLRNVCCISYFLCTH